MMKITFFVLFVISLVAGQVQYCLPTQVSFSGEESRTDLFTNDVINSNFITFIDNTADKLRYRIEINSTLNNDSESVDRYQKIIYQTGDESFYNFVRVNGTCRCYVATLSWVAICRNGNITKLQNGNIQLIANNTYWGTIMVNSQYEYQPVGPITSDIGFYVSWNELDVFTNNGGNVIAKVMYSGSYSNSQEGVTDQDFMVPNWWNCPAASACPSNSENIEKEDFMYRHITH